MAGKSIQKYVVTGTGKVGGKARLWIVATFPGVAQAKPWVALLNLAHKAGDLETVASMDVHAPTDADGNRPTDVKYAGSYVQYSPAVGALDEDTTLG